MNDCVLGFEPRFRVLERSCHLLSRDIARAREAGVTAITFFEPDAYDRQKHRDIPGSGVGSHRGLRCRKCRIKCDGTSMV